MSLKDIESITNQDSEVSITTLFNYSFKNYELLTQALISHSLVKEKHLKNLNEAFNHLVFLGESLLTFIIGELVYLNLPNAKEEMLTTTRMTILNNERLGEFSIDKGLANHIIITKGEEISNIRDNKKRISEVLKGIFGAIYLDCYKDMTIIKIVVRDYLEPIIKETFQKNENFIYYGKENEGWKYKNDPK